MESRVEGDITPSFSDLYGATKPLKNYPLDGKFKILVAGSRQHMGFTELIGKTSDIYTHKIIVATSPNVADPQKEKEFGERLTVLASGHQKFVDSHWYKPLILMYEACVNYFKMSRLESSTNCAIKMGNRVKIEATLTDLQQRLEVSQKNFLIYDKKKMSTTMPPEIVRELKKIKELRSDIAACLSELDDKNLLLWPEDKEGLKGVVQKLQKQINGLKLTEKEIADYKPQMFQMFERKTPGKKPASISAIDTLISDPSLLNLNKTEIDRLTIIQTRLKSISAILTGNVGTSARVVEDSKSTVAPVDAAEVSLKIVDNRAISAFIADINKVSKKLEDTKGSWQSVFGTDFSIIKKGYDAFNLAIKKDYPTGVIPPLILENQKQMKIQYESLQFKTFERLNAYLYEERSLFSLLQTEIGGLSGYENRINSALKAINDYPVADETTRTRLAEHKAKFKELQEEVSFEIPDVGIFGRTLRRPERRRFAPTSKLLPPPALSTIPPIIIAKREIQSLLAGASIHPRNPTETVWLEQNKPMTQPRIIEFLTTHRAPPLSPEAVTLAFRELAEPVSRVKPAFVGVPPGRGLVNLGCTCYMNSAIQLISAIPHFHRDLKVFAAFEPSNGVLSQLNNILERMKAGTIDETTMRDFFNRCVADGWGEGEAITSSKQLDSADFVRWITSKFSAPSSQPADLIEQFTYLEGPDRGKVSTKEGRRFEFITPLPNTALSELSIKQLQLYRRDAKTLLADIKRGAQDLSQAHAETLLLSRGYGRADIDNALIRGTVNEATMSQIPISKRAHARKLQAAAIAELQVLKTLFGALQGTFSARREKSDTTIIENAWEAAPVRKSLERFLHIRAGVPLPSIDEAFAQMESDIPFDEIPLDPARLLQRSLDVPNDVGFTETHMKDTPFFMQKLNRYDATVDAHAATKNTRRVDFDRRIEIPVTTKDGYKVLKSYEPSAVILHEGSMDFGHYNMLKKHDVDGRWYLYNDHMEPQLVKNINAWYQQAACAILWRETESIG